MCVCVCVWWTSLAMLLPQFVGACHLEANDINDADKRTFTTKQYKQKYIYISTSTLSKRYYECSKYSSSNIRVCVSGYCLGVCK